MAEESSAEFLNRRLEAVERMREMQNRAVSQDTAHPMPPTPPFLRAGGQNRNRQNADARQNPNAPRQNSNYTRQDGLEDKSHQNRPHNAPDPHTKPDSDTHTSFLSNLFSSSEGKGVFDLLKTDGDLALILGLLLLLYSENADRKLLLALLYILL